MSLHPGDRLGPYEILAPLGAGRTADIWIGELERGTLTRLTFEGTSFVPIWTPDGQRVTFFSILPGKSGIYWAPADGSGKPEMLLATENRRVSPSSWTPDGRMLLYSESSGPPATAASGPAGQGSSRMSTGIWILPVGGGASSENKPRPFLQTSFNETFPQVSPDGRWVAYQSDESGKAEIYVRPFPGPGGKTPISTQGGLYPRWSASGRELFYVEPAKGQLTAVDIQTGPAMRIGRPQVLFELSNRSGNWLGWDIAPDGKRILAVKELEAAGPGSKLAVVANWFEELRQRVPVAGK